MRRVLVTVAAVVAAQGFLAVFASVPARALPPDACTAADALRASGETASARKDYVALLRQDPALQCAKHGLTFINQAAPDNSGAEAQDLCDRGKAYLDLERDADALTAYKAALNKDPELPCATGGVETAGPSAARRAVDMFTEFVPDYLVALGLLIALALGAFFVLLFSGHIPPVFGWLVQRRLTGQILSPRLKLEALGDGTAKSVAPTIDARIKERIASARDEANRADALHFELDFGTPREGFAVLVGGDSGLKSALEKASESADQTKFVGALVSLIYAILPIRRLTVAGVIEPEAGECAAATLSLDRDGTLISSQTLTAPARPDATQLEVSDYLKLAEPAAVWVQYEVARAIEGGKALGARDAESYVYVRAGLDRQFAGEARQARRLFQSATTLMETNWAARLNLAMSEARVAQHYDRAVEILSASFEEIKRP
jgi:tetratricopeptide (TPR) repeat protein